MHPEKKIRIAVIILVLVAITGFTDALYLTAKHYMGELPVCTVVSGCEEVALSEYSRIAGIPISLLGSLFYTVILIVGVAWFDTKKLTWLQKLPLLTIPAFLFSVWLMYLMYAVIEAICIYCMVSAMSSTLLMMISIWIYYTIRIKKIKKPSAGN